MQLRRQKIKSGAALSTELNEQFDRVQKNYAAPEQPAFRIFNAQEMPLFGFGRRRRGNCEACGGRALSRLERELVGVIVCCDRGGAP